MKSQLLLVALVAACLMGSCTGSASPTPSPSPSPMALAPSPVPTEVPTVEATATPAQLSSPVQFVSKMTGDPNPFRTPLGVATDQQNDLYVVDAGNAQVQVFDSSGKFLRKWGSKGRGDGQFDFGDAHGAGGIGVDPQGNVYVGDFSHRVQKFDSQGTFLKSWSTAGHGETPSTRDNELYLAIDSQANVYAADNQFDLLEKFDTDGNFLMKWDGFAGEPGLAEPSVAAGPDDNIYVAEFLNGRVHKIDGSGNVLLKFFIPAVNGQGVLPLAPAVDTQGNMYFADSPNSRVVELDPAGTPIGVWGESGTGDGQFMDIAGLALDGLGNIYVSDLENDCVQKFKLITK